MNKFRVIPTLPNLGNIEEHLCGRGRVCTGECQVWRMEIGSYRVLLATAYPGLVFVCCNQCLYAVT